MMANAEAPFEIEIRCHFDDAEQAYRVLPFMRSCMQREVSWVTRYYGLEFFRSGRLLRVSEVVHQDKTRHYLGWKGPDTGIFANIRQEVDEEITTGVKNSIVLRLLGANTGIKTPDLVVQELERLGHPQFMSFRGSDLIGYDEALGIKIKLMFCPVLKWPVLVELEKTANGEKEAAHCEGEFKELSRRFQLQTGLVREEPPTLLYNSIFSR